MHQDGHDRRGNECHNHQSPQWQCINETFEPHSQILERFARCH